MPTFKRVSLAGSEELFRPTRPQVVTDTDDVIKGAVDRHVEVKEVVHAVRAHHYDEEPHSIEALLLIAADAISAARPGARRESLEAYVKRLEKLEEIANSFQGVQQSYAIQAGREVRILVKPEQIDDTAAQLMARDIAKRIESELSFPGQIRVTVVRETRAVEYAK